MEKDKKEYPDFIINIKDISISEYEKDILEKHFIKTFGKGNFILMFIDNIEIHQLGNIYQKLT